MGKWAARLAEKTAVPLRTGTDKTAERGLLSVLAVPAEGVANDFPMAPQVAEPASLSPDLSTVAWTDEDIDRFNARRARLMRWGWPKTDAEAMAERLVVRDRTGDDRVSCADCQHCRPRRCDNHRRAGLHSDELGRDLVAMLQRCPGFQAGTA